MGPGMGTWVVLFSNFIAFGVRNMIVLEMKFYSIERFRCNTNVEYILQLQIQYRVQRQSVSRCHKYKFDYSEDFKRSSQYIFFEDMTLFKLSIIYMTSVKRIIICVSCLIKKKQTAKIKRKYLYMSSNTLFYFILEKQEKIYKKCYL